MIKQLTSIREIISIRLDIKTSYSPESRFSGNGRREDLMMGDKKPISGPGTIVGANVKLVGTLSDANEIIIHGKIEGEVISEKSIVISETAYVKGPISADLVQIAGEVHGSIVATGKLEILPTGKVIGSTTTKDLNIRSGALFVGKSNMPEGEKGIVEEKDEQEGEEIKEEKEKTAYEVE